MGLLFPLVLFHATLAAQITAEVDINSLRTLKQAIRKGDNKRVGFLTEVLALQLRGSLPPEAEVVVCNGSKQHGVACKSRADLISLIRSREVLAGALGPGIDLNDFVPFSSGILSTRTVLTTLYDGSLDLSLAIDAAIVSLQDAHMDEEIQRRHHYWMVRVMHTCTAVDSEAFAAPNFAQAEGSLRSVLDRKVLLVSSVGPKNGGAEGDYTVQPPTGFWPDWLLEFCKRFNELSGPDGVKYMSRGAIECRRVFADGLRRFNRDLLEDNAHMSEPFFLNDGFYTGSGEPCNNANQSTACRVARNMPGGREECQDGQCIHYKSPRKRHFRMSCSTAGVESRYVAFPLTPRSIQIELSLNRSALAVMGIILFASLTVHLMNCNKADQVAHRVPGMDDVAFPATFVEMQHLPKIDTSKVLQELEQSGKFIIAFLNPGSGDQNGDDFRHVFKAFLGDGDFGIVCKLPEDLDYGFTVAAQRSADKEVIILACGGDGTVTWVLSELQQRRGSVFEEDDMIPPVGVIPLGTGNDLARSLGWGPALIDSRELESFIRRAIMAEPVLLDQWKLTLRPESFLPPSLRPRLADGKSSEYVGYFTNYFSVGMDAKTTYEVGRARHQGVGKYCFQTRCWYPFSFIHGGFLCYALNAPNVCRCFCCRSRPLNDDLDVYFDNEEGGPFSMSEQGDIRQLTFTNLNSYGAGMMLYDAQAIRDNVSPMDWKLETFTREGPMSVIGLTTAKKIMKLPCGSVPVLRQPGHIELSLKRGQYFQMDGEPWLLNTKCTATVEPNVRVRMLCPLEGGPGGGVWSDKQKRSFWEASLVAAKRRAW